VVPVLKLVYTTSASFYIFIVSAALPSTVTTNLTITNICIEDVQQLVQTKGT
jgi:hypothetical protein